MSNHTKIPPAPLSCYDNLEDTLSYTWSLLARGVKDRKSAFHTPTIATIGADNAPQLRTVVLRGCDVEQQRLRFHTDKRSAKVLEMGKNPTAAIHCYDAGLKVQLRLGVELKLIDGSGFDEAWTATRPMSRECYQVTASPGSPIDDPYDALFNADATQNGEINFAPIAAEVKTIEWLYLAAKGHRRAYFDLTQTPVKMEWLVP
jgi:hypothetical protein